jgi:hypothetical protein
MIIGQQLFKNMVLKMKPSIPIKGSIDIANVLCHHSLIKDIRFQIENEENKGCKDYFFWKEIFEKNNNSAFLIMSVLSIHNGFR